MKIVSLLPSSTEILYALGLGEQVAAVTHECDYPAGARSKPVITSSILGRKDLSSAEIDRRIREQLEATGSIYHLNFELLNELVPDLIVTQELCAVCAVAYPQVEQAAQQMPNPAKVISLEPTTLEETWQSIEYVGDCTGAGERARQLTAGLRQRVDAVGERARQARRIPRVLCLEWIDPPFSAGHWIPEMVELAGGVDSLGQLGKPSTRLEWQAVEQFQPEVIVVIPCGLDVPRLQHEFAGATFPSFWPELPALRDGRLYLVDGNAYFNRPGPRLAESLELLAHLIHPELFPKPTAAPEDEYITIAP